MQAYGRECHPLESSMHIDIPENETWMGNSAGAVFSDENYREGRAYTMINKFVSSGARFAGKKTGELRRDYQYKSCFYYNAGRD